MKLPPKYKYKKSFDIKGEEWRVAFVSQIEGKNTLGLCDPSNRIIYIRNRLGPAETFRTFLHEMIHVFESEYGITISHKDVYKLEDAIFHFLTENF
jgi:hypothetical protein